MSIPPIDIRHDLRRLELNYGLMGQERMKAAVRAMNRTIVTVRKDGAKSMQAVYQGLSAGVIKRQMRLERASGGNPRAAVAFSGKRLRLFGNWRARQTLKGVALGRLPWRIETGSGARVTPEMLRHAFIQRSRTSGMPNVWIRAGRERYPIEAIVAASLAEAFVERNIGDALARTARNRFEVVFQQEAKFRLSKRGA